MTFFLELLKPRVGAGHVPLFFDSGFFLVRFADGGQSIGYIVKGCLTINASRGTFLPGVTDGRDAEQKREGKDRTGEVFHIYYGAGV